MSDPVRPDHFYLIEGRHLIRHNLLCRALLHRLEAGDPTLSTEETEGAVQRICKAIPSDPVEAF